MKRAILRDLIEKKILIIDGAMGTQIQSFEIPTSAWEGNEGCNELLNQSAPEIISSIHKAYLEAGANLIKTNTFGCMPWVLDEYGMGERAYELSYLGAKLVKEACGAFEERFVLGSIGPGTKLPSLGHIDYDSMYEGYCVVARGLIDGGADAFLLETSQDPLQIKAAIHACSDVSKQMNVDVPIMVSATIEMTGTMLIGTDITTLATILEPFDILSLGINCGMGPKEVRSHIEALSQVWDKPISVHMNAGLPENRGGCTFYPMDAQEFDVLESDFSNIAGVAMLGGCCGTTPAHIKALAQSVQGKKPLPAKGAHNRSIASLFETKELIQNPSPFMMGERSNATGSKAFRELLLNEDYEGTLSVGQQQVRSSAHGIDVSVGFAGRDEANDMLEVISLYSQKIVLPLMPDSTQLNALEVALKNIGGRAIINSANLEDGEEKFDAICALAKRYGCALVLLTIDEEGMAKTKADKVRIALRMYERATTVHGLNPADLVFDMLTFTVGSGESEYFNAGVETIEAIRELRALKPEVGAVLGVSNISFGLEKHSREYLNSVFLSLCVEAGLTMAIVNVKNIIPLAKMSDEQIKVCEDLLLNRREEGDPLFKFIEFFSNVDRSANAHDDEAFNALSMEDKIHKLLVDGDKERMMPLIAVAKESIAPETIINELLINAMKEVGELFGSGKMQLPFVLQSAEVMKASVDYLNPFLPKKEAKKKTTIVLGTVKGDVHDVGKNLVDIILTNNGFHVINIGIKADIHEFINAYKEHDADALGMSGLLVKSTSVMKDNLSELKNQGIDVPVLLGGAALTRKFVDEFCRTNYDGAIFYCKDAFDGIVAMGRIEEGNLDTNLSKTEAQEQKVEPKKEVRINPENIRMPSRFEVPSAPFFGRKVFKDFDKELVFEWINKRVLFKQRWGYNAKGLGKEAYAKQLKEVVEPTFARLKEELIAQNIFEPTVIYGYFKARSEDNKLIVGEETLVFPRQGKAPHRALSDYFYTKEDVVALTCVSAGDKFAEYEANLFKEGKYQEYYLVHGLGVELAEALAEMIHKQIRIELNITPNEEASLSDVKMGAYVGARYSPGYPACPDLELNQAIFALLKPEEFGISLSETFQIHPEQSTCAIVVHNKEALYYSL